VGATSGISNKTRSGEVPPRGLGHQEASQAHVEEEAPQAAP
jgi:hypothetical protein